MCSTGVCKLLTCSVVPGVALSEQSSVSGVGVATEIKVASFVDRQLAAVDIKLQPVVGAEGDGDEDQGDGTEDSSDDDQRRHTGSHSEGSESEEGTRERSPGAGGPLFEGQGGAWELPRREEVQQVPTTTGPPSWDVQSPALCVTHTPHTSHTATH